MKGDVDVRCRYDREIYSNPENGYCIFQYLTEEQVPEGAKNSSIREIKLRLWRSDLTCQMGACWNMS